MIWVFKEHVVSSESVNHTCMWIVGGHIYPGCRLCATLWKRAGFLEFSSCMVSCGHPSALYLFCLIPALQHWQLSHQTMNTPPDTRAKQTALHQRKLLAGKGDQKAPLPNKRQPAEHNREPERRGMSTATSSTTPAQGAGKGPEQAARRAGPSCNTRTPQPWQGLVCFPPLRATTLPQSGRDQLSQPHPKHSQHNKEEFAVGNPRHSPLPAPGTPSTPPVLLQPELLLPTQTQYLYTPHQSHLAGPALFPGA